MIIIVVLVNVMTKHVVNLPRPLNGAINIHVVADTIKNLTHQLVMQIIAMIHAQAKSAVTLTQLVALLQVKEVSIAKKLVCLLLIPNLRVVVQVLVAYDLNVVYQREPIVKI